MMRQTNQTQLNLAFVDAHQRPVSTVFQVQTYNMTKTYTTSPNGTVSIFGLQMYQQVTVIAYMSGYEPLIQPLYIMSRNMSQVLVLQEQRGSVLEVVTFDMNRATPIVNVTFSLLKNGQLVGNFTTDTHGKCQVHNVSQRVNYTITVNHSGYQPMQQEVVVGVKFQTTYVYMNQIQQNKLIFTNYEIPCKDTNLQLKHFEATILNATMRNCSLEFEDSVYLQANRQFEYIAT